MKYRKKPVMIEAIQFVGNWKELSEWIGKTCIVAHDSALVITTLEGDHTANIGDYIIKGVKGEFYPCKPDIFDITYEEAEMTTHDRDKVIAAAKEAGIHRRSTPIGTTEMFCWEADIESLYAIAFEAGRQSVDTPVALAEAYRCGEEAGRQAERIVTIKDDDDLRFIKRVLEGANQTEEDKAKCLQLIREIRIRARGDTK